MRILPYPHTENQRPAVVLTFVSIKELKAMTKQLQFVEDALTPRDKPLSIRISLSKMKSSHYGQSDIFQP